MVILLTRISCAPYPEFSRREPAAAGRIMRTAHSCLGSPYRWGGADLRGFDCSGLVCYIYRKATGLTLPHQSTALYQMGRMISLRSLQLGDLLFFRNEDSAGISHVALYLRRNAFIHATASQGVIISSLNEAYYRKRLVGIKRILPD